MAKALQGMKLPPEVGLMPDAAVLPRGPEPADPEPLRRHMRRPRAPTPEDLFKVTTVVKGTDAAGTLEETGCKMTWPA